MVVPPFSFVSVTVFVFVRCPLVIPDALHDPVGQGDLDNVEDQEGHADAGEGGSPVK